jgi:hypothetical protein
MGKDKRSINRAMDAVYRYWNKKMKGIGICHRVFSDKRKRKIRATLNQEYTVNDICQAIFNYREILEGDEYFWTYAWTLEDFLQRGLDKFLTEKCYDNYSTNYPASKNTKPKVESSKYRDRFEQYKRATEEERKKLTKEWGT